jgi:hypothetical protein
MKKLSILFSMLAMVLGFTACEDDDEPVISTPTEFVLNTPPMADQYIELSENGTINLSWSQPDYGLALAATYNVQVAIDKSAFDSEDASRYIQLTDPYTTCTAAIPQEEVAIAYCKLHGFTSPDDYVDLDAAPLYIRVVAQVADVASSYIASNVIELKQVKGYLAVQSAGYIYLVGQPSGWTSPDEAHKDAYNDWRLFESSDAIGSHIYSGVFNVNAGEAMFRFYTALTGWEEDSYGSQEDDNPIEFSLASGSFSNELVKGKGSFSFPDWQGGEMTIVVDMSVEGAYTVTIMAGAQTVYTPRYIYLIGAASGWKEPSEDNAEDLSAWRLVDNSESGIYTGTFNINAGDAMFRFYTELTGWDGGASIGIQEDDSAVDCTFTDGIYTGAIVSGKGSFNFPDWQGGEMTITVDTNSNSISIKAGA